MNTAELYSRIKAQGGAIRLPRTKIKLTGADRVRYLNGQVSNDVRKLTPAASMHACLMTAKGKMCADLFITAAEDHLLVDAEPSLRESLAARLERYIISDDVTLEDVSDSLFLVHILEGAESPASQSRRYGRPGHDLWLPAGATNPLADSLPPIDEEMLEILRIEAGVPRWGFELGEETIPVEAGLDRDAIDYHKGCYIGQEVISRIKSIGHVNKELRGFILLDGPPPAPGMRLHLPGGEGREAGWLTSAAHSFGLDRPVALGYLKRGATGEVLEARPANEAENEAAVPSASSVRVKELPIIP